MKISREQASLIADLQARLVEKMDIVVGYSHPHMTVIIDSNGAELLEGVICRQAIKEKE